MKKFILLISIIFLTSSYTIGMQHDTHYSPIGTVTKNALTAFGCYCLFNHVVKFSHAMAHKAAFALFFDHECTYNHSILPWRASDVTYSENKVPKTGIKRALSSAVGPLCGLATVYALFTLNNIRYEYCNG